MKIAIIGGGISGLVVAHLLHDLHEITVFEAGDHIGGHTNTIDVELEGTQYAVDTGFIVYNEKTYPLFSKLLSNLGVETQASEMSFSVSCEKEGIEYGGTSINSLFAQRRNLIRPKFLAMVRDIPRFYKKAKQFLASPNGEDVSLGEFLSKGDFSRPFVDWHIIPMGAAVWSSTPAAMLNFPAKMFCSFFKNHGFLEISDRPQWRVVKGGSREYVKHLITPFSSSIRLNSPVRSVRRTREDTIEVITDGNGTETFDETVLACHSDQALAMLEAPRTTECEILGALRYQRNDVVLHTDSSLMPRKRLAWSAWNYHQSGQADTPASLSYNMNILQGLNAPREFMVTLNHSNCVDPMLVERSLTYHHPIYDTSSLKAQRRWAEISGDAQIHYCGAYWFNGFHEDGVKSGVRVAEALGGTFPR